MHIIMIQRNFFKKITKLSNRKRKSGKLDMRRHVESIYTNKSIKIKFEIKKSRCIFRFGHRTMTCTVNATQNLHFKNK